MNYRLNKKKKKRNDLEIVKDILYAVRKKSKKTNILYLAQLNYCLLEKYLNILLKNKLLNRVNDSSYLVSKKGKNFLKVYKEYLDKCRKIDIEIKDSYEQKMLLKSMCFEIK